MWSYSKPELVTPFTFTAQVQLEKEKQDKLLRLVIAAEKLFTNCSFPDKNLFLPIYNEFVSYSNIGTRLSLRMHCLFFFLKVHDDIINTGNSHELTMLLDGHYKNFTKIILDVEGLLKLQGKVNKEKIDMKKELINNRTSIIIEGKKEVSALINKLKANNLELTFFDDELQLYDSITYESYSINLDE